MQLQRIVRRASASVARLALALFLFALVPQAAGAASGGVVSGTGGDGVWLKAGPQVGSARLTLLPEGTALSILGGPTAADGYQWFKVEADGQIGYVVGDYLKPTASAAPPQATPANLAPGGYGTVTGVADYGGLKLRAAPSPAEPLLAVLPEGTALRILEGPTTGGNGNPWYRVAWGEGWGWVDGSYLRPGGIPAPAAAPASGGAAALVQVALAQVGKPYGWGATGPDRFDCSGLVYYAARKALGIIVPRVAADQAVIGVPVAAADLAPGDLVFYENTYGPGITHVGIYIGNRQWVGAADENSGVIVISLDEAYWKARYVGARRIT